MSARKYRLLFLISAVGFLYLITLKLSYKSLEEDSKLIFKSKPYFDDTMRSTNAEEESSDFLESEHEVAVENTPIQPVNNVRDISEEVEDDGDEEDASVQSANYNERPAVSVPKFEQREPEIPNEDVVEKMKNEESIGSPNQAFAEGFEPVADGNDYMAEFIKAHVTQSGFLIVTVVNWGHLKFLMNWIMGMKRNLDITDEFIVVCLDPKIYDYLQERSIPSIPITSLIDSEFARKAYTAPAMAGEKIWATYEYFKLVNFKVEVVYQILSRYSQRVIFTDVDLVWKNEKIPSFIAHEMNTGNKDFVFSLDNWQFADTMVCTGFYAVQPSEFALQFMKAIVDDPRKTQTHDQDIAQTHIRALSPQDHRRIQYLPLLLFQNGQVVDLRLSEYYNIEPWLIHANFRIGVAQKEKLLRDQGVWYVPDDVSSEFDILSK